ncbi:hypothetical protein FHS85_001291 [Rhodoligotrophos appendicifer]|uniref:hypothetical protein n=1 Tax=Rhodoligotrophos appendicifer TaxID=987056 RepID=UPI0011847998|nr:hypothetical protein [Rhodoligotrophos appendicifer]
MMKTIAAGNPARARKKRVWLYRICNRLWTGLSHEHPLPWGRARRAMAHLAFQVIDLFVRARTPARQFSLWEQVPPIAGDLPRAPAGREVLIAFGDPVFVARYGPPLLMSLAARSPNTPVHLHVFGTEDISARLPADARLQLSITYETVDRLPSGTADRVRFFQSMRFIRLAQFLHRSPHSFLAIDIDSVIAQDLSATAFLRAGADIGLIKRDKFRDPGKKVLAAALYAAPTDPARRFMRIAATRMLAHLEGVFTEKLDQRCLYLTFRDRSAGVRIAPLPMSLAAVEQEGATILSLRGPRKNQDLDALLGTMPAS